MSQNVSDGGSVERKVQMTGGSTYTVSIPKSWANANGITTGSGVHLYPFDDRLVIAAPDDDGRQRLARIDIDTVGGNGIGRRIDAAYAAGADEITIRSDTGFTPQQRRQVNDATTDLIGMEIATETDRELVARNLLNSAEVSIDDTIDQIRGIALSMNEDAIEAVVSGDEALAARVVARDDDVDRLFALISRQFHRVLTDVSEIEQLQIGRETAFTRFRTARQLERIADHAELIAGVTDRQTEPPDAELGSAFERVAADARRVVRTALDGNTGEAILRRDDVIDGLNELDRRLYENQPTDAYLYGRMLESIRRTAEYGGNIAEISTLSDVTDRC